MPRTELERTIELAVMEFAYEVVNAVKKYSLQELMALQASELKESVRSFRKLPARKRTSWPKCAHPGCEKNRFSRSEGYCGEHWRARKEPEPETAT